MPTLNITTAPHAINLPLHYYLPHLSKKLLLPFTRGIAQIKPLNLIVEKPPMMEQNKKIIYDVFWSKGGLILWSITGIPNLFLRRTSNNFILL